MAFVADDLWRCPVCGWLLESSAIRCDQCGASPGFVTAQAGKTFPNHIGGLPFQLQGQPIEGFAQQPPHADGVLFQQSLPTGDTSSPHREDMYVGIGMPQGFAIGGQAQQQLQTEDGRSHDGSTNYDPQGQEVFHNGFNAPPRPDGALFGKQLALDMEFPNLGDRRLVSDQPRFDQQLLKEQDLAHKPFGSSGPVVAVSDTFTPPLQGDSALYGNTLASDLPPQLGSMLYRGPTFFGSQDSYYASPPGSAGQLAPKTGDGQPFHRPHSADAIPSYRSQSPLQPAPQNTDRGAFSSRSSLLEGVHPSQPLMPCDLYDAIRPVTGQSMFSESRPVTSQSMFSAAPTQRSVGCSDGGSVFYGSSPPRGAKGDSIQLFGPPASAKWLATQPMQSRRRFGPLHHSGGLVLGSVTE